jgi:hypothetical protein
MEMDWVDLARVDRIDKSPIPSQVKGQSDEKLAKLKAANAEFGNRLINTGAEKLAKLALEMLDKS